MRRQSRESEHTPNLEFKNTDLCVSISRLKKRKTRTFDTKVIRSAL